MFSLETQLNDSFQQEQIVKSVAHKLKMIKQQLREDRLERLKSRVENTNILLDGYIALKKVCDQSKSVEEEKA